MEELKERLSRLDDPRRTEKGNIRHKLEDIIIIGLCTLVCTGEDFPDMEQLGKQREDWLIKFLPERLTRKTPQSSPSAMPAPLSGQCHQLKAETLAKSRLFESS